jgi:predicted amidohydrolase
MIIGAAQFEPTLGAVGRNVETCKEWIRHAGAEGCELLVLPECATSGYVFEDRSEAYNCAAQVEGSVCEELVDACGEADLFCAVGMLERDGERLYNTALLLGPSGVAARYRKAHIPFVGVDRFVERGGDPFDPADTPVGRIGLEICYDMRFPEISRALALRGAEIILHPTNWVGTAATIAEIMPRTRAVENRVYFATANRIGVERGTRFIGQSLIVDPDGNVLARAGSDDQCLITAEVDPASARVKDIVPDPGACEIHLFSDRRPELYSVIAADSALPAQTHAGRR